MQNRNAGGKRWADRSMSGVVLAVLMEITENGAYSHKILGDVLSKYQYLEKKERAFITRVTEERWSI